MPQHAGERLDIHAVLKRQRRECMAQVMEADVLDLCLYCHIVSWTDCSLLKIVLPFILKHGTL
jgi:hypothetical protein